MAPAQRLEKLNTYSCMEAGDFSCRIPAYRSRRRLRGKFYRSQPPRRSRRSPQCRCRCGQAEPGATESLSAPPPASSSSWRSWRSWRRRRRRRLAVSWRWERRAWASPLGQCRPSPPGGASRLSGRTWLTWWAGRLPSLPAGESLRSLSPSRPELDWGTEEEPGLVRCRSRFFSRQWKQIGPQALPQ